MFVIVRPFQPSLMFVMKAGAYPSEAPFRCAILDRLLVLPTNIRLGWNGLPRTNTIAYYKPSQITAFKSFITMCQVAFMHCKYVFYTCKYYSILKTHNGETTLAYLIFPFVMKKKMFVKKAPDGLA